MTKKEYLNQAYWLDRRIDSKLEQLSALKDMATRTTSVMSGEVVSHTRNVSSMQDVIVKIITMENEVNADIDRLVDLKAEIASVISQVRNESYRLILEKRYLCFQTWAQIGADLHYTRRWLLTKHERAVDIVEKLISEREAGA
jgi:hypothetical protein